MDSSIDKDALRLHIAKCVGDLPALPDVVGRVLELTESPTATASDLERVIGMDQAIAGKLLRVVNSAFYGAAGKVSTISHAVMVLGVKQLRNLTLSVAAMSLVKARMPHMMDYQRHFWRHSLGVACGAAAVAKHLRLCKDVADEAFTGGLLHDLGRLFLLGYFFELFAQTKGVVKETRHSIVEVERSIMGIDHMEIGAMLGAHWHFPPPLIACIARHHGPLIADEFFPLTACVHIGDVIMDKIEDADCSERTQILPEVSAWANLSEESLDEFAEEVSQRVSDAEEFLKAVRAA